MAGCSRAVGAMGSFMLIGLCAAILLAAGLQAAQSIFAPIAFALFLTALVWPIQRELARRIPRPVAMVTAIAATLVAILGLAVLIAWAFGGVAQWVIANSAQLQALYQQKILMLEGQGIAVAGLLAENFSARWLVRVAQEVTGRLHGVLTFAIVTVVFLVFGLMEVAVVRRQLERMGGEVAPRVVVAAAETARKFRTWMLVRTLMSVVTGLAVWGFASWMGLDLAAEWGVIAFVLNYIPFLGPLVATIFPAVFAILQFEAWQPAVVVFLSLNLIQTASGSYIEPWLTGATLAVSSFMVLLAVFFGAFLWGIPGAFIGVPVLIAILTACKHFPRTQWLAELLSGRDAKAG